MVYIITDISGYLQPII